MTAAIPALPDAGPGAPPRDNGELVFDAPWQSRVFGVTAALAERGQLDWSDFQQALIGRVAAADETGVDTVEPAVYWGCWLDALGDLTGRAGMVESHAWSDRCAVLAAREPGHDHDHHDHHHDHDH